MDILTFLKVLRGFQLQVNNQKKERPKVGEKYNNLVA